MRDGKKQRFFEVPGVQIDVSTFLFFLFFNKKLNKKECANSSNDKNKMVEIVPKIVSFVGGFTLKNAITQCCMEKQRG